MSKIKHKFSVIGLAETNTNPVDNNIFPLDEYTSFYQDIHPTKLKGTGVALYVHNSLNPNLDTWSSQCSDNLESLFVKIQIGTEVHTVGVIYNP